MGRSLRRQRSQVKRTEGVSTTDIVGRMLMCGQVNRMVRASMDSEVRSSRWQCPCLITRSISAPRAAHPHDAPLWLVWPGQGGGGQRSRQAAHEQLPTHLAAHRAVREWHAVATRGARRLHRRRLRPLPLRPPRDPQGALTALPPHALTASPSFLSPISSVSNLSVPTRPPSARVTSCWSVCTQTTTSRRGAAPTCPS